MAAWRTPTGYNPPALQQYEAQKMIGGGSLTGQHMDPRPQLSDEIHNDTPVTIRGIVESCCAYRTNPATGRYHRLEPNTT
jgi:hypothetical protein